MGVPQNIDFPLKAGFALAIFAFNNTSVQFAIREAGGVSFGMFQTFLDSPDIYSQCNAAFQVSANILLSFSFLFSFF